MNHADPITYAVQSRYSDPGVHAALFDDLPSEIPQLTEVVRNLLIHYRGGGIEFTGDRLEEINHRWIDAMLATDQRRNGTPLATLREPADRVAGCCRDYALLTVSALRHKGIPARSRIGFASYFVPGFNHDHVVVEYWNGERWVMVDPQVEPAEHWGFDVQDMPAGRFRSAAEVWLGFRSGALDGDLYGVDPSLPLRGGWFIRDYVFLQLAHLQRDELLLWDGFGGMADDLEMDLGPTDEIAALLVASDNGDEAATTKLAELYRDDPELHPGDRILVHSPSGTAPYRIDLTTRQKVNAQGE
ncbi:transglutaminase-like domain-containing protein [Kribbella sp. VKM Ac-2568]|uniref:transglutaminase-like domain-containing protein n=1 Tax=Kribbella sp. VKM Ac-2568 TaxID=2512219 RepID=UPI001047A7CD|nr:transglutaminase-like domain-containing protein [Kribbella sp. VKM Ac-2568]TCM40959.1 transglutaminase superfamily protein [Kribbella sp. VKM Ac-2568]